MSMSYPTRCTSGRAVHSGCERLARGLGWFSIGLGVAELFASRTLCRALGMEQRETLVRAYGVREIATGVAILMSHDPTPWIWGRVGGDAIDIATLATAYQGGNPQSDNLTAAIIAVAGVTALDIYCAQNLTSDKRLSPPGTFNFGDRSGFPKPPHAMRGAASDATPSEYRIPKPLRSLKSA